MNEPLFYPEDLSDEQVERMLAHGIFPEDLEEAELEYQESEREDPGDGSGLAPQED